jgi:hypothetical protein
VQRLISLQALKRAVRVERLTAGELAELELARPKTRGQCVFAVRPCPWVACRYHLYADITERGALRLNFPGKEPWELRDSCALDLADREKPLTLWQVGELMAGVNGERVRQIEASALAKLALESERP